MKITEVYFRSSEKKPGQQWFEVFNDGPDAINLKKAVVSRYDGKKSPVRTLVTTLPDEDLVVEPGVYAIIAQRSDLGQNLCSAHRVIVAGEPGISFKSQGVQRLCILTTDPMRAELEACAQIADSKAVQKDRSRDFSEKFSEDLKCELKSGLFASPGLPGDFCQKSIESGWSVCPEPVASPEAVDVKSAVHQTARHGSSGCQQVSTAMSIEFMSLGLLFLFCVTHIRRLFERAAKDRGTFCR